MTEAPLSPPQTVGTAHPTARSSDAPLVERVLAPFRRFTHTQSASGIVLLAATAIALGWANSPWAESYHHLWELPIGGTFGAASFRTTLHHLINDGLMAVFFFLVGLEIKREIIAGELASLRTASLPMIAALGGMVVPAAIYAMVNRRRAGHARLGRAHGHRHRVRARRARAAGRPRARPGSRSSSPRSRSSTTLVRCS